MIDREERLKMLEDFWEYLMDEGMIGDIEDSLIDSFLDIYEERESDPFEMEEESE